MSADDIRYSDKYEDDNYIYRHVMLPPSLAKQVPKTHQMTETEWRNLGVQQSPGWVHYMLHLPEPHVLLFRRPKHSPPDSCSCDKKTSTQKESNTLISVT
uniref:Cyclin-dependent kinases regulatory subunit n=1 Tax=Cacopsylla melanoneura TaxID=428564 RepID=A0A8D9ETB2_9HEMI